MFDHHSLIPRGSFRGRQEVGSFQRRDHFGGSSVCRSHDRDDDSPLQTDYDANKNNLIRFM